MSKENYYIMAIEIQFNELILKPFLSKFMQFGLGPVTPCASFVVVFNQFYVVFFPSSGNIRLPLLFERNPREVPDSYKLPSQSLALPSY